MNAQGEIAITLINVRCNLIINTITTVTYLKPVISFIGGQIMNSNNIRLVNIE